MTDRSPPILIICHLSYFNPGNDFNKVTAIEAVTMHSKIILDTCTILHLFD